MTDIVERLRGVGRDYDFHDNALVYEAAIEIERLREEIKDLKATIQNLRAVANFYKTNGRENDRHRGAAAGKAEVPHL